MRRSSMAGSDSRFLKETNFPNALLQDFVGYGFSPNSWCARRCTGNDEWCATCGDTLSATPASCGWTFDGLDSSFKLTSMLTEKVRTHVR